MTRYVANGLGLAALVLVFAASGQGPQGRAPGHGPWNGFLTDDRT
jgi:hypothetical protein